ncbi:MAG: hypothetical protein FJ189_01475, partial [Gammaproteobacteria bacterium]|nr:hypothetical protein [Gammaproteobacteria bacterium]
MTRKSDQALVPLDERLPAAPRDQGDGSILQCMARGALEIAQRQAVAAQVRHWVGDYELAEPDYRQVLLWAERLALAPEEVLERLAYVPCGDSLQDFLCLDEDEDFELEIKDGHI